MSKTLALVVIILFFSLISNCEKKDISSNTPVLQLITVEILKVEPFYKKNMWIVDCKITNHSNQKLYFPINRNYTRFYIDYPPKELVGSYFYALFYDQNDRIIYPAIESHYVINDTIKWRRRVDSLKKVQERWVKLGTSIMEEKGIKSPSGYRGIRYKEIKENGFFLNPQNSKTVTIKIDNTESVERKLFSADISYHDLYSVKTKFMQIAISVDSAYIKNDILFPEDIDSLQKNNIKIFNGTVYSDKVPWAK